MNNEESNVVRYPECEKMIAAKEQSQLCGEFFLWLNRKYQLIDRKESFENNHIPFGYSSYINIEEVLADFFGIDLDLVEKEKRQALEMLKR